MKFEEGTVINISNFANVWMGPSTGWKRIQATPAIVLNTSVPLSYDPNLPGAEWMRYPEQFCLALTPSNGVVVIRNVDARTLK